MSRNNMSNMRFTLRFLLGTNFLSILISAGIVVALYQNKLVTSTFVQQQEQYDPNLNPPVVHSECPPCACHPSPTLAPTNVPDNVPGNNNNNESNNNSTNHRFTCPSTDGVSVNLHNGTIAGQRIELVVSEKLCTLVHLAADGSAFKPVARSYGGNEWEASAGDFAGRIDFNCSIDDALCIVDLPGVDHEGAVYQLTTFDMPPQYSATNEENVAVARFLEQATFGPTRAEMATFVSGGDTLDMAEWISEQQTSIQTSSHRQAFRVRLNARQTVATPQGAASHPCHAGSRYRKYSFSFKDRDQFVTIASIKGATGGRKTLQMDGIVRTTVDGPIHSTSDANVVFEDGIYQIMWMNPRVNQIGYDIHLQHPTQGITSIAFNGVRGNPSISFSDGTVPNVLLTVLDATPISFQSIIQEIILTKNLEAPECVSLGAPGNPINPVYVLYDGEYYIHDPRFETLDNNLGAPAPDGGGQSVRDTANVIRPEESTICSNVPRSFLNDNSCYLSYDPAACSPGTRHFMWEEFNGNLPDFYLHLTPETLREIYQISLQSGDPRFVYAIEGLRSKDDVTVTNNPPCKKGARSRWLKVTCTGAAATVDPTVHSIFREMLTPGDDILRDLWKYLDQECPAEFFNEVDFEIEAADGACWLNVHPDHWNVYDFTAWTNEHPGNIAPSNPIQEAAQGGNTSLSFPDWHDMSRWENSKIGFGVTSKLYDVVHYYQLPPALRSQALSEHFGFTPDAITYTPSDGVLVCGSPDEVANDPMLGGDIMRGAFDSFTEQRTTEDDDFSRQKRQIWTQIALEAPDQLRQRVAWALSQIFVVSPEATLGGDRVTEDFVVFYDIFVRNAFGNYRDILKEVAYSPAMAQMLTYWTSESMAYTWRASGNVEFADENFAREVMQLFSTGLVKLNVDGTPMLDENGEGLRVYTNDDIMEYARVWTGFIPQPLRGNIEQVYGNQVDPMTIDMRLRDWFPKMGLERTYVGDFAPLCADLPDRHFLKPGATYRLLGKTSNPELQVRDPTEWASAPNAKFLTLQPSDGLFSKLCGSDNATLCAFPATVVLDSTIPCAVDSQLCRLDTIRTVEVANGIFYEYVRPPCTHQAFFNNGKTVVRRTTSWDLTCADPRLETASAACCIGETKTWNDEYWGERLTMESAQERCGAENLCSRRSRPSCDEADPTLGNYCADNRHFWTNDSCSIRAKIDRDGKVAIVHAPQPDTENETVNPYLQEGSVTFFRVDWTGGDSRDLFDTCSTVDTCYVAEDGMCICDVTVSDESVFASTPTRDQALNTLRIGAFDPSLSGIASPSGSNTDVKWYSADGTLTQDSVFEVTDHTGMRQFRKNLKSTVVITGTSLSFRNPVHYISLSEPELRDAHYEVDAAIDHYVKHKNTAPFLAVRLSQRFGISNPSPRYVRAIANAFTSGTYTFKSHVREATVEFGSGTYGDLAAAVACVLLDREARSLILDADPSHGSLREPLIKLIGLMRSLDFKLFEGFAFVDFHNDINKIMGQMAHALPNVFSFFLPEYKPSGPMTAAALAAPEAQVLTGPRIIETMNGLLSLIKFGLSKCFGGLHVDKIYDYSYCDAYTPGGNNVGSSGKLDFSPSDASSSQSITDELATLLTGGRLSVENRQLIDEVIEEETDPAMKVIKAQQLMVLAPEFHGTSVVRKSGESRPAPSIRPASSKAYKAVVHILLEGGMDSFNLLVPHTCTETNPDGKTLVEQYNAERTSLAITSAERSRVIDATGQPCSQFAVHHELEVVERLYKSGDLAFFANAGVLNKPSDKDNYQLVTRTQLFAHNAMQQEAQKIDPFERQAGTGILGRMCDVLGRNGYSAQPIAIEDATVATVGVPGGGADPLVVSPHGTAQFLPRPASDEFDPTAHLPRLNDAAELHSSLYGETWSRSLQAALHDSGALLEALSSSQIATTFPDHRYSDDLKAVSALVSSREKRGTDRDVFFVSMSGWDHHSDMKAGLAENFRALNGALAAFEAEMKAQGRWSEVTVVVTSDFGRTLTANSGEGSDHAWGGIYFAAGGAVEGGQIHGAYPGDITFSSPLNIGRGRLIPTMSWESIFNGVAQWMGVLPDDELDYCLPNRIHSGATLLTLQDIFKEQ